MFSSTNVLTEDREFYICHKKLAKKNLVTLVEPGSFSLLVQNARCFRRYSIVGTTLLRRRKCIKKKKLILKEALQGQV